MVVGQKHNWFIFNLTSSSSKLQLLFGDISLMFLSVYIYLKKTLSHRKANDDCTTERNCGFDTWYAKKMSSSCGA